MRYALSLFFIVSAIYIGRIPQAIAQTSRPHQTSTQPATKPSTQPAKKPSTQPVKKPTGESAVLFLFPFSNRADPAHPRKRRELLGSFESVQIQSSKSRKLVRMDRVGSAWSLTFPLLYPVDSTRINKLLGNIVRIRVNRVLKRFKKSPTQAEKDRSQWNRSPISLTVKLKGKPYKFLWVRSFPASNKYAMYLPHRRLLVEVDATLYRDMKKSLFYWKRKQIFPTSASRVTQLAFGCGIQHVLLQRKQRKGVPDQWWAEAPYNVLVKDSYRVSRLLAAMGYLKVHQLISHAPKRVSQALGLSKPDCVLQLVWKSRPPLFYRFKRKNKYSVYVTSSYLGAVGVTSEFFVQEIRTVLRNLTSKK